MRTHPESGGVDAGCLGGGFRDEHVPAQAERTADAVLQQPVGDDDVVPGELFAALARAEDDARECSHRRQCPGLRPRAGDRFYEGKLGLKLFERGDEHPYARFSGAGETKLGVYESGTAGQSRHTLASFVVDDVVAAVRELRANGVVFEEYDTPGIKTEDGVATTGDTRTAGPKDPDGNILEIAGA